MSAAAAEQSEPSDWMSVSHSDVTQQCTALPTLAIDPQALSDSIFTGQHTLWFALTDAIQRGGTLVSLPDLTPDVVADEASKTLYREVAAEACRALCIQVLSSAIEELEPRHIDVPSLQATLTNVKALMQSEPAVADNTTATNFSDPTLTGSTTGVQLLEVPAHVRRVTAIAQQSARNNFWMHTEDGHATGDCKLASNDPEWIKKVLQSRAAVYEAASSPGDERRLRSTARLIITDHPDRAQRCANPA